MRILIEGPDCCGKTTISKELANRLNFIYFHNPQGNTELSEQLYSYVKTLPNPKRRAPLATLHEMNYQEILKLEEEIGGVVVDRGLHSFLAYQFIAEQDSYYTFEHYVNGNRMRRQNYDVKVLLWSEPEIIVQRMKKRGENTEMDDEFIAKLPDLLYGFDSFWEGYDIANSQKSMKFKLEYEFDTDEIVDTIIEGIGL